MEKLTAGRIKECLTGWGFPSVTSEEKWLEDWKIVEERYPNGNQYAFIEHVFHKGKKYFPLDIVLLKMTVISGYTIMQSGKLFRTISINRTEKLLRDAWVKIFTRDLYPNEFIVKGRVP